MKIDKKAVGARLKRFLLNRYSNMNEAAAALGTTADSIRNSYFNGQSLPGAVFTERLKNMGCSIDWLLFGTGEYEENETRPRYPQFRVEATVPAGEGDIYDMTEWGETAAIEFKEDEHYFVKVDEEYGYSMLPFIQPGDMLLVSSTAPITNNDIVAARWDQTRGAIKLCSLPVNDPQKVAFISLNPMVAPMVFNKRQVRMHKVVLIMKDKKNRNTVS
ncbi:MAG: hypothetical protein AMXMBFR48_27440 [Ignavibacteriales bacterium]